MKQEKFDVGYIAHITKQGKDGYLVEFPQLPGCLTEGDTLEKALVNAKEALSGWLFVAIKNGDEIPLPKEFSGRNFYKVEPDIDIVVPLLILWARKKVGMTQTRLASELGISQQAYRKLEIPGKSNPSIKTLAKLLDTLGLRLEFSSQPQLAACSHAK
jgi:antitoxin HicB